MRMIPGLSNKRQEEDGSRKRGPSSDSGNVARGTVPDNIEKTGLFEPVFPYRSNLRCITSLSHT